MKRFFCFETLGHSSVARLIRMTSFRRFCRYPQISRVVIYGSRAMGTFRAGSDIDLAMEGQDLDISLQLKLLTEIEESLIPYKIDLCIADQITNVDLRAHIQRVGQTFCQAPPCA